MIYEDVRKNIGNTPLIRLKNIEREFHLDFEVYGKLERSNPSGSIKDRAALFIIEDGLQKGLIDANTTIVEATSGNTGISISMIAASLGLKCKIFMPSSASKERILMMQAFGSEVVLVNEGGMKRCVELAEKETEQNKVFLVHQFENEANIRAHYEGTSKEIIKDLGKCPDYFVAGFGTAGTLIGNAKRFKNEGSTKIIGVEPLASPLVNKGFAGPHKIQGIGANFIPELFKKEYVDEIVDVSDQDAYEFTNVLAKREGLFVGISSGAAVAGVVRNKDKFEKGTKVIVILPDNGERYLSVEGLYE